MEVCVKVIPHLPKSDEELIASLLASAQAIPRLIIEGYAHRDNGFTLRINAALDHSNEMVCCLTLLEEKYRRYVSPGESKKLIRAYNLLSLRVRKLCVL